MKNEPLQAIEHRPADLVRQHPLQSMQHVTETELRFMMETLDLEDALAESVQHARHFGEHDIALSLAMILEGLRVRLWEQSSDAMANRSAAEI